ncbi:MAG: SWIM zinc finger family protein, partial [Gaiellaceae bacterium]
LATAAVVDETSPRAERGRTLARSGHVHTVTVTPGRISARVIGSGDAEYDATITADVVPPRTWAAVSGSARSRPLVAAAIEKNAQSMHLQHEMMVDWGEPLVPPARAIRRTCTCPDSGFGGACKHVAALAYVIADAIDQDPSLLLRWRGCTPVPDGPPTPTPAPAPVSSPSTASDRWQAGTLPALGPARALPVAAVLKRLGRSGIRVDNDELVDVLRPAYAAFATSARRRAGDPK